MIAASSQHLTYSTNSLLRWILFAGSVFWARHWSQSHSSVEASTRACSSSLLTRLASRLVGEVSDGKGAFSRNWQAGWPVPLSKNSWDCWECVLSVGGLISNDSFSWYICPFQTLESVVGLHGRSMQLLLKTACIQLNGVHSSWLFNYFKHCVNDLYLSLQEFCLFLWGCLQTKK